MSHIKCPNCENECSSTAKFCAKCGAEISIKDESKLKGVGGWLVVVILGLIFTLYTQGITAYRTFTALTDGTVEQLSTIQGFAGAITFELIASTLIFMWVIYLLYLSKKEDRRFPKFYIYFLVSVTIYIFLDTLILSSLGYPDLETKALFIAEDGTQYTDFAKTAISSLVWGIYMRKSRRVKLTFVK